MLTLTESQKKNLESLKSHPWMEVVLLIVNDEESKLASSILTKYNLEDEKDREKIKLLKIYNEARQDFVSKLMKVGKSIYTPNI